jgi:hypothetical protein
MSFPVFRMSTVRTKENKDARLFAKIPPRLHALFEYATSLRDSTMSHELRQFAARYVREVRAEFPKEFAEFERKLGEMVEATESRIGEGKGEKKLGNNAA